MSEQVVTHSGVMTGNPSGTAIESGELVRLFTPSLGVGGAGQGWALDGCVSFSANELLQLHTPPLDSLLQTSSLAASDLSVRTSGQGDCRQAELYSSSGAITASLPVLGKALHSSKPQFPQA